MYDEHDESGNHPPDDELSAAMMLAAEMVVRIRKSGRSEFEFPLPDNGNVWVVTVKKLGIVDNGEQGKPPSHGQHYGKRS